MSVFADIVNKPGVPGELGKAYQYGGVVANIAELSTADTSLFYLVKNIGKFYGYATDEWVEFDINTDYGMVELASGGTGIDNNSVPVNSVFSEKNGLFGSAAFGPLAPGSLPVVPIDKGGTGVSSVSYSNRVFASAVSSSSSAQALSFRALVADDIPNFDVSKIESGTMPITRGGTGMSSHSMPNKMLATAASGTSSVAPSFRALVSDDMPEINVSKITSGIMVNTSGGTGIAVHTVPNLIFATHPSSTGANYASFRTLQPADITDLPASKFTSGTVPIKLGGTGVDSIKTYSGTMTLYIRHNNTRYNMSASYSAYRFGFFAIYNVSFTMPSASTLGGGLSTPIVYIDHTFSLDGISFHPRLSIVDKHTYYFPNASTYPNPAEGKEIYSGYPNFKDSGSYTVGIICMPLWHTGV